MKTKPTIPDIIAAGVISGELHDEMIKRATTPVHDPEADTKNQEGQDYVDHMRELKDISTDFVTTHFLGSRNAMFNFLQLVYSLVYESVESYKQQKGLKADDIVFLYKGGNVLRVVANEFMANLPGAVADDMRGYYSRYFKMSDSDFSIYIRPTIPNFEDIAAEMSMLAYITQYRIRAVIMRDPARYFDFMKYGEEYRAVLIRELYNSAAAAESFSDPKNVKLHGKKLESVVFQSSCFPGQHKYKSPSDGGMYNDTGKIYSYDYLLEKNEFMNIKLNVSTAFVNDTTDLHFTAFNLVRTKIAFNYWISGKNVAVGGELIDISIPYNNDLGLLEFYKHRPLGIHKYILRNDDEQTLGFYGYSVGHLITDMEKIVFRDTEYPWSANKYTKRIYRLMFYYFIDMFDKPVSNEERAAILDALVRVMTTTVGAGGKSAPRFCKKKAPRICMLFGIVNKLQPVRKTAEFAGFAKVIVENVAVLKKSLASLTDFCAGRQTVRVSDLYDDKIDKLA